MKKQAGDAGEEKKNSKYPSLCGRAYLVIGCTGLEFWQRQKNISTQTLEDDMVNHLLNGKK